jgi:hypothetical protein
MAAAYSVATRIVGEDLASEVFRKVGDAAKSAFKPIADFKTALSDPKTTGLGRVGVAVDKVAGKFRSGLSSISAWLPALGAIGAAASLGGLIELTRHAAEGYEGLTLSAQKLGASTGDLAVWRYGAKLAGVESEKLDKGLVKLNKAMYDAATGKNKDAAALFAAMKIPLRDANGGVKTVSNSLEDIAEAFKNTENAATRDAAAMLLFGKAGADLLPFLVKGRAGIAELRAETKKYSGLTDENREALEHLAVSYKHLDKAGSGLSTKLSAVFAPTLSRVVDRTTDWIVANRDLIAANLEKKLDTMSSAFERVAAGISKVLAEPFVQQILGSVSASDALNAGLVILGVTMAGPVFAALQLAAGAVWRMNAAMLANPAIAIGAVIVGTAIEIATHWDEVKQVFADAWKDFGVLGVVFQAINVPINACFMAINEVSKALFGFDIDKWGADFDAAINRTIGGAVQWIRDLVGWIEKLWGKMTAIASVAGGAAKRAISSAGQSISDSAGAEAGIAPPISLPSPPSPDSPGAVAGIAAPPGKVDVSIDFANVPKGAEVRATSSGVNSSAVNVGRSMDAY